MPYFSSFFKLSSQLKSLCRGSGVRKFYFRKHCIFANIAFIAKYGGCE
ncbi:Uncharacterized protein dnm_016550 [Desulfonema magnum]|uniref:Uncharacterized protein n=1 Tax=Desulfonema magnum TaxID=45655 RepID=A0A975BI97_9BACT|nr:Uncharacterized protein dnm_016550 [Desulfonema magnum]